MWVYHYILMLLAFFDIRGHGGRTEVMTACGKALDQAKIGPQKIPPPFVPFHGCKCKKEPNTALVFHCMRLVGARVPRSPSGFGGVSPRASKPRLPQVEAQIVGMFFIVLVKSTLQFQGLLFEDESASCPHEGQAGMMVGFVQLFFVICGLSGIIPLVGHLTKLVLPSRQPIVSLRNKMYIFILPWSSAVQTVILFGMILGNIIGECSAKHADQVTLAVEMLLFQIVSHRAFVPMFIWGPHKPPPPFLANGIPDDFQFIVAPDKMAAVYGGAADAKVAQGGAETELPVAAEA